MLISLKHNFTLLSCPKCATTSIEQKAKKYCDITLTGTKRGKHTTALLYQKEWEPFIAKNFGQKPTTIAVIRHPIDHLISWYKYRTRDKLVGRRSLKDISFDDWMIEKVSGGKGNYRFYTDENELLIPDVLIPIEIIYKLETWLATAIGKDINFGNRNQSPNHPKNKKLSREYVINNYQHLFSEVTIKNISLFEYISKINENHNNGDIREMSYDKRFLLQS